jgi:hypothetical protein
VDDELDVELGAVEVDEVGDFEVVVIGVDDEVEDVMELDGADVTELDVGVSGIWVVEIEVDVLFVCEKAMKPPTPTATMIIDTTTTTIRPAIALWECPSLISSSTMPSR